MEKTEFRERRALSAARGGWQSAHWYPGAGALALLAGLGAFHPIAQASEVQTLPLGAYACELPGDAMVGAGQRVSSEDFAIVHSSTYASAGQMGSYLLMNGRIEMTSGPKRGETFHRISDNFLRKLNPDGSDSPLRCVRIVANNHD
jgi:hypothetical protein